MIDFLGIGAQRCGTSWLHQMLKAHPQVQMPHRKELHYWDRHRPRGVDWWLGQFPAVGSVIKRGEITPAYALLTVATIREVRTLLPEVRLFLSIRNPMARAWSAALLDLTRAGGTPARTPDDWFIAHFCSRVSLSRGDYALCLDNWLAVFPEEQLSLIMFDDICQDPKSVLMKLAEHLGIGAGPFKAADDSNLRMPVFAGSGVGMRPSLLEPLRDLYASPIEQLAARLGCDLERWLRWVGD